MDFVPGEPESVLAGDLDGVLVTRSLTKLWGIAGLRAGFVAGDQTLIGELARHQEPWAVSTPALDAMVAIASGQADRVAARILDEVATERAFLVDALRAAGFPVAGEPRTPFVLVDVSSLGVANPPEALAAEGFAVRRCDTFPGLGPDWIRVSVPSEPISAALVEALVRVRGD
jgi:histidinol-phosphate/aromatic aminotransferase/cobyric acid decarboxylase-like protein